MQKYPKCKSRTKRIQSLRMQKIQSSSVARKRVYLHVKKRRYRCTACGHTSYEKLKFVHRYQRQTLMLAQEALVLSAEMSFKQAGRLTGVSTNRILRMFDARFIDVKKVLPRAIAIDEFKGDAGGEKYQTIIVDVEKREVIDILLDQRVKTIESYFKQFDTGNVQIVVMDLSKAFKQAVQRQLGNPLIIADRFHFMRQAYGAFDQVRREVQYKLYKEQRIQNLYMLIFNPQ